MFNCLLALQKCKSLCNHKLLNTLQFFYDTTKRGGVDNQSEEFSLSGNDKPRTSEEMDRTLLTDFAKSRITRDILTKILALLQL